MRSDNSQINNYKLNMTNTFNKHMSQNNYSGTLKVITPVGEEEERKSSLTL